MHDVSKRPKVGAGIIIRKGDEVVIQQRKNAHGHGTWSVPGGHMEFGESPEETARREALEEANVQIADCRVVWLTNDCMVADGKHYITIFVEAKYASGELKNTDPQKVVETKWSKLSDMPEPMFLPIKNFLSGNRLL